MSFSMWEWAVLLGSIVGCALMYGNYIYGHFARRGVKYIKPSVPLFGNSFRMLMKQEHFTTMIKNVYNAFPGERYVGYFELVKDIIIIKDIELIKKICIKDFNHFIDHRSFIEIDDSIFSKHLVALKGQRWKDMRGTLSPAFTSAKMKSMFSFIVECAEEMTGFYDKKCKESSEGTIDIEMKDTFTRYSNDVIATCAFGLNVNSFKDEKNEFFEMGKKMFKVNVRIILKYVGFSLVPKLMKLLKITVADKRMEQFFQSLVQGTMKFREENNIVREDMIHLLMEAKKGSLKHDLHTDKQDVGFATAEDTHLVNDANKTEWSDDDLTAQVLLFFVAGFDTSSTLLSFIAHELAANPDIQSKVHREIDDVKSHLTGKLTYNDLQNLKYMDMVISETLRIWPPALVTDRLCVKSYTLPPPHDSGKEYQLHKKSSVWIPIYAIHHDPKYFPNPEKFDPERFSDENKNRIKPFTFLPFGIGPRNCIGSRFALMTVKAILFYFMANFEFLITSKTKIPLKLSSNSVAMKPKDGFWLALKPRNTTSL